MRGRAGTVCDLAEIGDVALVWLVEVDAVPACWESDLSTETAGTVVVADVEVLPF